MKKNERGITLIALVVTIIVLIILASISIATLTGDDGIINQSKEAKEETEIAEERETVEISAVQASQSDAYGNITEENLRKQLDKNIGEGKYELLDVIGEKFKVTYIESQRSYYVDKDGNIELVDGSNSDDEIYSEVVSEEDIAPEDLFNYEIISTSPTKEARITGIKPEYCNSLRYNPETKKNDFTDTNYNINYEGIIHTLVIESCDHETSRYKDMYRSIPSIENIIYPNTVTKIISKETFFGAWSSINKKVVLPSKIIEIPKYFFSDNKNLEELIIPDNVTTIGREAFGRCTSLRSITIPDSVTNVGANAFEDWTSSQTINLPFKEGEIPEGWNSSWNNQCDAKINYLK